MNIPDLTWLKPAIWGVIGGAAVWWIILAAGFGWMSPGTATHLATKKARAAVVAYAAPMCVARFMKQSHPVSEWKALKKSAANYNQTSFLEKLNLLTEPGQKLHGTVADAIANACSSKLLALKSIDGTKLAAAGPTGG